MRSINEMAGNGVILLSFGMGTNRPSGDSNFCSSAHWHKKAAKVAHSEEA